MYEQTQYTPHKGDNNKIILLLVTIAFIIAGGVLLDLPPIATGIIGLLILAYMGDKGMF